MAVQRFVLLVVPGVVASWWGGGAAIKAHALGLGPSSLYYRYLISVWPTVASCVPLGTVWWAFGVAARKASAEFEEILRRTV